MKSIHWKIHLKSAPEKVFSMLTRDVERMKFWAERTLQHGSEIRFQFPNGQEYVAQEITRDFPVFELTYFNSKVSFRVLETEDGTVLELLNSGIADQEYAEVMAGWVSVLLNLKAVADHSVDLRNHHGDRTWDQGFIDN